MSKKSDRSALFTVFLVVLIDLMGFGIVLPLLPFYAAQFNASPVMIGVLYSIYSLMQLVFSPFWGSLSDRVGRRPIMLMSTLGASTAYILFAFSNSLPLLLLSRALAGIMGGNISTAQAYVADVTGPEERAKGMGLLGAAFGIGFALGPALATALIHPETLGFLRSIIGQGPVGAWVHAHPYSLPGFAAALLSLMSFALVASKLPETAGTASAKDNLRVERSGIFTKQFWDFVGGGSAWLPKLLFCMLALSIGQSSLYSAFPLFCHRALDLSPQQVGMQFVWMGLIAILVQGGMIRPMVKRFGEERLFLTGCVLATAGFALLPLASNVAMLTVFLCLLNIGVSLAGPTLTSLISKTSEPAKVGATMGRSQGLAALGRVIGPTWGGWLFSVWLRAPFFATAAVVSTTIWVGARLTASTASGIIKK